METTPVHYHQVCPTHGLIDSAPVPKRLEPKTMRCPSCGQHAELWLGAATKQRKLGK
jgi:hypothetical protein